MHRGTSDQYFLLGNRSVDRDFRGANLMLKWESEISDRSNINLISFIDYDKFDTKSVLSRRAITYDVDFQHFYTYKKNQLTWGFGFRYIQDRIEEHSSAIQYKPRERINRIYTAFLQEKYNFSPSLSIIIGSKFEYNDYTNFNYQPNARITYYPSNDQTLWTSVSKAVRTPTRGEEGITLADQRGSTKYDNEELIAYEIGYRINITKKVSFDIATFFKDYSKLRTFDTVITGSDIPTASNYGYGESYGAEISTKWKINRDLSLELGYDILKTTLHIDKRSDDTNLEEFEKTSPRSQVRLQARYNFAPNIEFDNTLYYVDDIKYFSNNVEKEIDSYFRLDSRVGYLFENINLELSVVGQNILGKKRHQEFGPGLINTSAEIGRSFYFKLAWEY